MGIVSNYLINLITRQVNERGIVVWFDPEKHYSFMVKNLDIPNTGIIIYEGSFIALRNAIEPFLNDFDPPRLVLYVPMDQTKSNNALIEAEAFGTVIKPGQQPPIKNTRLSLIARNALKPILGEETASTIEKQVEEGKLTLEDLDQVAEKGEGITKGVASIIFETTNPQDIALQFLSSEKYDKEITKKNAINEISILFESSFGIKFVKDEPLESLRTRFIRYLLMTDLASSFQGKLPSSLSNVEAAKKVAMRDACTSTAKNWRLRQDLNETYVDFAKKIEKEIGLVGINFERKQILQVETFLEIEKALQKDVEAALLKEAQIELVELAKSRQSTFWSKYISEVQAQWALIATSGQVLLEANRIEKALKPKTNAKAIFNRYTQGDAPWCLLDTYHRQMEKLYHTFEFALDDKYDILEKLVAKARQRYMEVAAEMSQIFLENYQHSKFQIDCLRQTEIFNKKVKPKLEEGKTAYVWVDALRYEMASELAYALKTEFEIEMDASLGTIPTITSIGMAALLPKADESATITVVNNKLALEIDKKIIKDRKDRIQFFNEKVNAKMVDVRLEEMFPVPKKKLQESIKNADLVLLTAQEIDELCEGDNVHLARRHMDEVLYQLKRAFHLLTDLGVCNIVFAADHGYLFGEELSSADKIDPPGPNFIELHRRAWIGQGGAAGNSYLRAKLSDFGLGSNLEIAVPWNFACFKVKGGAKAYFHGGMSLQELVIPVVTLKSKKKPTPKDSGCSLKMVPRSKKISTRLFSVEVNGFSNNLYEPPPKVRIEIRFNKVCISSAMSASYGFEAGTGDVQLNYAENGVEIEPNTITLMLTDHSQKIVSVHLFDSITGVELNKIENIEMSISI